MAFVAQVYGQFSHYKYVPFILVQNDVCPFVTAFHYTSLLYSSPSCLKYPGDPEGDLMFVLGKQQRSQSCYAHIYLWSSEMVKYHQTNMESKINPSQYTVNKHLKQ